MSRAKEIPAKSNRSMALLIGAHRGDLFNSERLHRPGLGACLRWWLGLRLNSLFPLIPPGTLAANLIGGYIIGVAVAIFALKGQIPTEVRLIVITGFLGGLTTFSTFSSEVVKFLLQARFGWAMTHRPTPHGVSRGDGCGDAEHALAVGNRIGVNRGH